MSKSAGILILDKTQREQNLQALQVLQGALDGKNISSFEAFTSAKAMLSALPSALNSNANVIIAAEPSMFYSAKNMLIKALSLKTAENSDVAALLPVSYTPKSDEEYAAVTRFPCKAKVFPTQNGFFTSFLLSSGGKNLLFLPLKASCLRGYLSREPGELINSFDEKEKISDILPVPDTAPAEKKSALPSLPKAEAQALALKLEAAGLKVAVAKIGASGAIDELFGKSFAFIFDDTDCDKWTDGEFNDYFAAQAKNSAERNNADMAVALSGLYTDNDTAGKFMFCCVADKTGADIIKVSGESAAQVASDCTCRLIELLDAQYSKTSAVTDPAPPACVKPVRTKRELIIASISIAVSVIICAVLAFVIFMNPDPAPIDTQQPPQSAQQITGVSGQESLAGGEIAFSEIS